MQVDLELYREEVTISTEPLVRLSYIDIAPEEPQHTIIMVHGYGGRALHWQYQLRALADNNRVIALDMRGHGSSDKPPGPYDVEQMVDDLEAAIDKLDVQKPFMLMGHSFAGAFVTEYALRHPDHVAQLVLIAAAGEFKLQAGLRLVFSIPTFILNPITPFLRAGKLFAPPHVLKAMYFNGLDVWTGWDKFARLKTPTLVIRGDRDRVFPQAVFEEVARSIPNAQEVNVGVSAHMVMLERRDAVQRAIERFLGTGHDTWRDRGDGGNRFSRLINERPWIRHYEEGVSPTIGLPRRPLHRLLQRAATRFPNVPATIFEGRKLTYRQINRQANRLGNAMRSLGLDRGSRVMLLLPNTPQFVIAMFGILKAGGVVVSASPVSEPEEVVREVQDSQAEFLITLTMFHATARLAMEQSDLKHVIFTSVKDYLAWPKRWAFTLARERRDGHALPGGPQRGEHLWVDLMRGHHATELDVEVDPDSTATIIYTGGTTDQPKGVMLSHYALLSNAFQTRHWLPGIEEGKEVVLCVVPFAHSYGLTAAMNTAISLGATMVVLPNFVTRDVLQAIKRYKPTLFPGVPSMYANINQFPGVRKYNVRSIEACISGAAALPVEVAEAFEKLTKGRLVEGYGLTEAGPATHANPVNGLRKFGTIGVPLPNTEARVVDILRRKDVEQGQIGELLVRGPQVMQGYLGQPEATKEVLKDGWLATGDIVRMDRDGYFQVISRSKDMILAGTYQVYPRDVEEVLHEDPAVKEVAVVGLQKPLWPNKRIKAYVVLSDGQKSDGKREELIELCKRRLEEYAVPWDIEFRDDLPRSFLGKVVRRLLVEEELTRPEE